MAVNAGNGARDASGSGQPAAVVPASARLNVLNNEPREQGAVSEKPTATLIGAVSYPYSPMNASVACIVGCGYRVRPGRDADGEPFLTCCNACGENRGHSDCAMIPEGPLGDAAYDAELAMALHAEDVNEHRPLTPGNSRSASSDGRPRGGRRSGNATDEQIAYQMQMSELRDRERQEADYVNRVNEHNAMQLSYEEAEIERRFKRNPCLRICCQRWRYRRRSEEDAPPGMEDDDIWGECPREPGVPYTRCQKLAWNICPCFVVGFGPKGRQAWKKYVSSLSWIVGVIQVLFFAFVTETTGGVQPVEINMMLGPHYFTLNRYGAKNTARILYLHEWWRLLTPMLLHAGWIHLVMNLTIQWRYSVSLELKWGRIVWFIIYLVSGIYATVASCVWTPNKLSVGSSGALCGLIGAWFAFTLITWNQTLPSHETIRNAETFSLLFVIALTVGLSFLPMVDFAAHVGGLLIGFAVSMCLFGRMLQNRMWRFGTIIVGSLLFVGLTVATVYWLLVETHPGESLLHLETIAHVPR